MRINWEETVNSIFADHLTCPKCEVDFETLIAGYSRKPAHNQYAPRHRGCPRGDDCDARKLIVLCQGCARTELLRGTEVTAAQILETYMMDVRRDLEEALDYVAEYWRDDFDLEENDFEATMEQANPDAFREESDWRNQLEDEYLQYHRVFRERHLRIPMPGWRAEYTEEILALGYTTKLGE
ncbi:MAG TPA: hypothetical protein QF624_00065 [Dehalococcoidia bacterium]|nr:hypothetical protein [Dehalococcoidia bacterium]